MPKREPRQLRLGSFESDDEDELELTDAEREVWDHVETGKYGVREYARETDRRPGTIGNLLRRAREKKRGDVEEVRAA